MRRARDTVGRTVSFNSFPVTIVGIAPPQFQGTTVMRADTWLPLLYVVGRGAALRPRDVHEPARSCGWSWAAG